MKYKLDTDKGNEYTTQRYSNIPKIPFPVSYCRYYGKILFFIKTKTVIVSVWFDP